MSAISYLNTAPLMWDFEHGEAAADFDISYTIPSACARALASGTSDIGIIPAAAYTTIPDLVIVPDVAIAARRAVRSILLVSKKPIDHARTVALDTSSMTSVALTKIVFAKWLGGVRAYSDMAPDLDAMLSSCDAALADRRSGTTGRSREVHHAGPGGGVASANRKIICVRLLGYSTRGARGTGWLIDCPGVPGFTRPWSLTGASGDQCAGMGATAKPDD